MHFYYLFAVALSKQCGSSTQCHSPVLVDEHQPLDALRGSEGLGCLQAGSQDLGERAQYRHHRLLGERAARLVLASGQVGHEVRHCMQTCGRGRGGEGGGMTRM